MEKIPPHPLSAQDILVIWETGAKQHLLDRGLTILSAGYPLLSWPALADLSIGQRDSLLLELYTSTFGGRLSAQAACPACQHVLEFGLEAGALRLGSGGSGSGRFEVQVPDGPTIEFRLPTSRDLASLVTSQPADGTRYLAQRCVLQIRQQGEPLELDRAELPDGWLEALNAGLSAHDPQADLELELTCPVCAHNWQLGFDILDFFWTEIKAQARRLVQEVHLLARAYGWDEQDILNMSAARRSIYLELVGA